MQLNIVFAACFPRWIIYDFLCKGKKKKSFFYRGKQENKLLLARMVYVWSVLIADRSFANCCVWWSRKRRTNKTNGQRTTLEVAQNYRSITSDDHFASRIHSLSQIGFTSASHVIKCITVHSLVKRSRTFSRSTLSIFRCKCFINAIFLCDVYNVNSQVTYYAILRSLFS